MRKIGAAIILLVMLHATQAQDNANFPTRLTSVNKAPNTIADETTRQKWLNLEWTPGIVHFRNGVPAMKVPVLFDEFGEKLYYQQGSTTMEFNHPVASFNLLMIVKGDSGLVTYRNGYPPIHKNTTETFYQVVVDGKYQLLKCRAKTIGLYKEDVPEDHRKEQIKEMTYALLPNGQIVEIKKDKDYLYSLPEAGDKIRLVAEAKNLRLKNDKAIQELFESLNGQP